VASAPYTLLPDACAGSKRAVDSAASVDLWPDLIEAKLGNDAAMMSCSYN
jgi:hypothetical protein